MTIKLEPVKTNLVCIRTPCCKGILYFDWKDKKSKCAVCHNEVEGPLSLGVVTVESLAPEYLQKVSLEEAMTTNMVPADNEHDTLTICGVLKKIYNMETNEEIKELLKLATAYAKRMDYKLRENKRARGEEPLIGISFDIAQKEDYTDVGHKDS